jgi:hypothetical protein
MDFGKALLRASIYFAGRALGARGWDVKAAMETDFRAQNNFNLRLKECGWRALPNWAPAIGPWWRSSGL